MKKHIVGCIAVILSVFSLVPTFVPGAMSLIGLLVSHFALVLSLGSVAKKQSIYFRVSLVIVLAGVFFVNDTLRVYGAMAGVPIQFKVVAYGLSLFVIVSCVAASRRLSLNVRGNA